MRKRTARYSANVPVSAVVNLLKFGHTGKQVAASHRDRRFNFPFHLILLSSCNLLLFFKRDTHRLLIALVEGDCHNAILRASDQFAYERRTAGLSIEEEYNKALSH
jgi:hypothetical protein